MIKHLEIKSYEYGDVKVKVEINYDMNTVSLLENCTKPHLHDPAYNSSCENNKAKKYIFAGRGPEFKNGWLNILSGIEYAVDQAFTELVEYKKMKEKEKIESVEAVLMKATELVKSEKKICKYSNCQNTCKSKGIGEDGKPKYGNLCQKHKGMEK